MKIAFFRSVQGMVAGLAATVFATIGAMAQSPAGEAAQVKPGSISSFFRKPELSTVRLSPSGRWLAALVARPGERSKLVVIDLDNQVPSQIVAAYSKYDVLAPAWVSDDLLIFSVDDNQDRSKNSNWKVAGLASVRRNGEGQKLLIKREWDTEFPATGLAPLEANHEFMAMGAPGTDEIIVADRQYDAKWELRNLRLVALNARTGARRTLLDKAPPNVTGWWFDHKGQARIGLSRQGEDIVLFWRDSRQSDWSELVRSRVLNLPYWPSFIDGEDRLHVTWEDPKTGDRLLSRFDSSRRGPELEPIVKTPGFDGPIHPIVSRENGGLLGMNLLVDGRVQAWMTARMQEIQLKVDQKLPGRINLLSCAPCDEPKSIVIYSYTDRHPGTYYVHHPKGDRWVQLGARFPDLVDSTMGSKQLHRIKARDGADLPVWVTLPAMLSAEPMPAVVLVHGGPWTRGTELEWDAESQFLASRGYVVIEPEFRGSLGYGDAHYRAGWKQWGKAMQDDVSDALAFAVQQRWVNPARACIAGASYGGYATLMGLAKDPAQYRCGIAWAAVTDPRLMFSVHWSDISSYHKRYTMPQMIGDPETDASSLAAVAPIELAARIKSPLMLVHGSLDRRVPIVHGERMRDALIKAGNPPEWHVYGDDGHGWRREENTIDFWQRAEKFLARHLAP